MTDICGVESAVAIYDSSVLSRDIPVASCYGLHSDHPLRGQQVRLRESSPIEGSINAPKWQKKDSGRRASSGF